MIFCQEDMILSTLHHAFKFHHMKHVLQHRHQVRDVHQ